MTGKDDNAESLEKSTMTNQELLGKVANRRGFISRAAGAVGAAATLPGLSSASDKSTNRSPEQKQELTELAKKYASTGTVTAAVRKHASEVIKALHQEGYLKSASARDLNLTEPVATHDLDSSDGVAIAGAIQNKTPTAWIEIRQFVGGNRVSIVVLPELDRAYASVRSTTSQDTLARVSSDGELSTSKDDVSTNVEIYRCCEYRISPEGYEYCQEMGVECWGKTTDERCQKSSDGSNCCTYCGNCPDDCCLDKCGYK